MLGAVTGEVVLRFTPPYGGLIVLALGGLFYYRFIPTVARHLDNSPVHVRLRDAVTRRQHTLFITGLIILALMESWPSLELARYVSSLAYLTHTMIIELVAVPLLLLGVPTWLLHKRTETPFIDALLQLLTSPILTTILYCGVFVLSTSSQVIGSGSAPRSSCFCALTIIATATVQRIPKSMSLEIPPANCWSATSDTPNMRCMFVAKIG